MRGRDTRPNCIHNPLVACAEKNCSACGWDPEVAKKRIEAFKNRKKPRKA